MTVEVKARLTLDTSDFREGAAETDQLSGQLDQRQAARAAEAEAQNAARAQTATDREARRLADREAREQAAQQRATQRAQASAERDAARLADQEAREAASAKRREERAQAEATRSAERAARQAAEAQRLAQQTADKEKRVAGQRAAQLQFQVNDIVTGLGTGQSPLTVALQQGPQITQIYGGFTNMIAAIPKVALAAGAAVAALAITLGAGIASATESTARQRQYNIELQATGNVAATTAARLDELVRTEARRAGAGRDGTAAALSTFIANPNLESDTQLARTLAVARDIARVQGQELPAAAEEFNRSLDGTAAGARRLDQAYNILTAAEHEQIRLLDEQGRRGEVVNIVLEATERRFKGLNEKGVSPTTKALKDLGNAWTDLADKVGRSAITEGAIFAGTQVLKGAAMLVGGPPQQPGTAPNGNSGLTKADLDEQRGQLRQAEEAAARLKAMVDNANPVAKGYGEAEYKKALKRVEDLRANVASLERDLQSTATATESAKVSAAAGEQERRAKETQEVVAGLRTVEAERRRLQETRSRIKSDLDGGILAPEAAKEAREAIRAIDGQLAGLSTTSEKLQRDLDLEEKLSKLPPHVAALQRAWEQTYRAAKEAGDRDTEARAKADQARANAARQQATATQEQINLLGAEARAALEAAAAYGQGRAAGLRAAALGAARTAEAQGQIAPGTAEHVAQETLDKNAAATVAAAAEKNRAYQEEIAGLERLTSAEAVSVEAAREAERANRVAALATELRAQAAASGSAAIVAAAEREIAKYDELSRRQLVLDRRRAANQFNAQFDPDTAHAQQMAQLAELQATGELTGRAVAEATKQYELQRLDASRDATDGMVAGLRRYADEATNAGRTASEGIASGMRAAEDAALGAFGLIKMSGTEMVNSLLADIARLAIRQNVTGPIAQAVSSALPSIGGWLGGLFGGGNPAAGPINPYTGFTMSHHTGGIVGRDGKPRSGVPLSAWDAAPRYHSGGPVLGAGEVPIIAKRGEEVLTEDDPRHRFNLGRRAGGGNVYVNIQPPAGHEARAQQTDLGDGSTQLDVMFEQIEGRIADNIGRWRGPAFGAITSTFGVAPVGRGA